ncbi:hypothetical protein [Puniceibacterium confluentis]|uniref:hypothetical protein n=1 Tax=Puniceibacterium confluentis TaxID=1958944 RepID=UPI0011B5C3D8|nr:hypothetical protein [Puniceibacterium confluentis]
MKTYFAAGACALGLGACTQAPTPLPDVTAQLTASQPAILSPVSHADPLAGYTHRGPVGPRDWRLLNQEQAGGH